MYIETERLIIRDFEELDADALYKIKYDEQVMKYHPTFVKRNAGIEDVQEAISYFISVKDLGNFSREVYYPIILKEKKFIIGVITVSVLELLYETQIGWMMSSEYTGHGYASEAGKAVSDYLLESFSYDYLVVVMDIDNPASFRTAQKSGFRLFEKRVPYDYFYSKCDVQNPNEVSDHFMNNERRVGSCYYIFRKFNPKSKIKNQFYGDTTYDGRFA